MNSRFQASSCAIKDLLFIFITFIFKVEAQPRDKACPHQVVLMAHVTWLDDRPSPDIDRWWRKK